MDSIINIRESSGQAGCPMTLMLLFQRVERSSRRLANSLIIRAYLTVGECVGLGLRLVDNILGCSLAVTQLGDARARVNHPPEQRFIMHDMRVVEAVRRGGDSLGEVS